ncbi:hypothetical protein HPP92_019229 [Vanilla planifolia]|uniref:GBF-interacting protein 1 N-terminal domain-containing protein n=1 Tax=Vanilla planifolia TaxID=51239 RepID=A0A835Q2H7_VANPL|nr:hypothetical protein HPP92_019229 [Vanilla planifolia]
MKVLFEIQASFKVSPNKIFTGVPKKKYFFEKQTYPLVRRCSPSALVVCARMSGVSRVSIPNSVRKTIQNIKEIAGNHSDEEIYAMLKECSMDPNETAQKLLFQDTFHEVRRKRDKKKERSQGTRKAFKIPSKWGPSS